MGILANARHERFAQELAVGKPATEAYALVGFEPHRQNAHRLMTRDDIKARVAELLSAAAERAEITQAMVLRELAKIGFADIRRAVRWYSQANVAAVDTDGEMQALVDEGEVRFAVANQVELISSSDIDDNTAAAIAEIGQSSTGALKIKLHDKRAALVDIGKHLGMFKEHVELSGHVASEPLGLSELLGLVGQAAREGDASVH